MKRIYIKPHTRTVFIVSRQLLAGSVTSVQNDEDINWKDDGFPEEEPDY